MAKIPEKSLNPYTLGRLCHWLITIAGIGFFAALFDPMVDAFYLNREVQPKPAPTENLAPVESNLQQVAQLVSAQTHLRYTITDHQWVALQATQAMPPEAFIVGQEGDGHPLVLCRAVHLGINRPGKVVNGYCNIAVFEADPPIELYKHDYEVLVTAHPKHPDATNLAWISRQEHAQSREAYLLFSDHSAVICRTSHFVDEQFLGIHPGMIDRDRCMYPYAEDVFAAEDYEVLTVQVER
ncbi:MAG: hypothetical protein AAF215_31980 [Cyanobacteria bacterium P01_A01_bin.123]